MEGKPSGFDRALLGFLALLSPGPELVTGCPELESDRTPLAHASTVTTYHRHRAGRDSPGRLVARSVENA
jgi:hypothetical protein